MSRVSFPSEVEYEASITERVQAGIDAALPDAVQTALQAALSEIKEAHEKEIAALNVLLTSARESSSAVDYSAYAKYPDLIDLMKKADVRPQALPGLCALQLWGGVTTAEEMAKNIGTTPKLGDKGGVPATTKIIASALQKLERGLLAANLGIGVKVTSERGKDGKDGATTVRRIKFTPMQEIVEPEEQQAA